MTEREQKILTARLNPRPLEIAFPEDGFYRLNDRSIIMLELPDAEKLETANGVQMLTFWQSTSFVQLRVPTLTALEQLNMLIQTFWDCDSVLDVESCEEAHAIPPEGYEIAITASGIRIRASEISGVRYAFQTLRQLAETERGVLEYKSFELPFCRIKDAPAVGFRGLHVCWFPENHSWQIERAIRLAAYYKYNYVVLETWGVFPFEDHPYLCWPDHGLDIDELKRIIAAAKMLGVTVIPQFNLLGHASGSRENGGKHVVLNNEPQYESLFEPDGWSWCISNPETRKVLKDCVLELLDVFDHPPFFHIGCDEARLLGTCRECRSRDLKTLLLDHLKFFHDLLKDNGARAIMWHDMLLNREDPRWDGYIVCGREEEGLGDLYKSLPKDMVIADWQYDYPEKDGQEPSWPTSHFFKEQGFDTIISPGGNLQGIRSLSKMAASLPLFGVLETTWSELDRGMMTTLYKASAAIWHGGNQEKLDPEYEKCWAPNSMCMMHHHLRQVENDMGLREYESAGRIMLQMQDKVLL